MFKNILCIHCIEWPNNNLIIPEFKYFDKVILKSATKWYASNRQAKTPHLIFNRNSIKRFLTVTTLTKQ